jgi:hypothetical protein
MAFLVNFSLSGTAAVVSGIRFNQEARNPGKKKTFVDSWFPDQDPSSGFS